MLVFVENLTTPHAPSSYATYRNSATCQCSMMAQMVKITNCSCSLHSIECSECIVLVFVSNLSFYFFIFFRCFTARQLGLCGHRSLSGDELEKLPQSDLVRRVQEVSVHEWIQLRVYVQILTQRVV